MTMFRFILSFNLCMAALLGFACTDDQAKTLADQQAKADETDGENKSTPDDENEKPGSGSDLEEIAAEENNQISAENAPQPIAAGGNNSNGNNNENGDSAPLPPIAPKGFAYPGSIFSLGIHEAITDIVPTLDEGEDLAFSIAPNLPSGLSMDSVTGIISGSPSAISPASNYTVVVQNESGSQDFTLNIKVEGEISDKDNSTDGFGSAVLEGLHWDNSETITRLAPSLGDSSLDAVPNLIAYWQGEGTIGDLAAATTSIADSSSSGIALAFTENGSAPMRFQRGKIGSAVTIYENTDYLATGPNAAFDFGAGNFSFGLWFKPFIKLESLTNLLYLGDTGASYVFLKVTSDGKFMVAANSDTSNTLGETASTGFSDLNWHHAIVSFDSGVFKVYLDGQLVHTSSSIAGDFNLSAGIQLASTGDPVALGSYDEIFVLSAALSDAEALALYERQKKFNLQEAQLTSRVFDSGYDQTTWGSLSWKSSTANAVEFPRHDLAMESYEVESAGDGLYADLLAYYRFNDVVLDGSVGGVKNLAADKYHGQGENSPIAEVFGFRGGAVDLSAADSHIFVPSHSDFDGLTSVTITAWINPNSMPVDGNCRRVVSREYQLNEDSFSIGICGGGDVFTRLTPSVSGSVYTLSPSRIPFVDAWFHVAMIYDGSIAKIFINSHEVSSVVASGVLPSGSYDIAIGTDPFGGSGKHYPGMVDEVMIWKRALSMAELEQVYNRYARRLDIRLRSCSVSDCSDASFIGPDGTAGTAYNALDLEPSDWPSLSITNIADARYFQYQVHMFSNAIGTFPGLKEISISASP